MSTVTTTRTRLPRPREPRARKPRRAPRPAKSTNPAPSQALVVAPKATRPPPRRITAAVVADDVMRQNDLLAAAQIQYPFEAAQRGKLVDAPVADSSPVNCFSSQLQFNASAWDDAAGQIGYLRLAALPCMNQHVYRSTASNNGVPTAGTWMAIESISSISSLFDDARCTAIAIRVKYTGTEKDANGYCRVGTFNSNGTGTWAPGDVNPENTCVWPPNAMHYGTMPWMPIRPEVDFAFISPTAAATWQASNVFFEWTGARSASTPLPTFLVEVCSLWAGRPLPTANAITMPRIYLNSQDGYEKRLLIDIARTPLESQKRVMRKDDGPTLRGVIDSGFKAYDGASSLFSPDSSWRERGEGALNLASALGSIGGAFLSVFGAGELVSRRLIGLTAEELQEAKRQLDESACDPGYFNAVCAAHHKRRHITDSRRTHVTFAETCWRGRDFYSHDELSVVDVEDADLPLRRRPGYVVAPPPSPTHSRKR